MSYTVWIKFNRSLRLEIGINNQIDIKEGDIVEIPIGIAAMLEKSPTDYGSVCDEPGQTKTDGETKTSTEDKVDDDDKDIVLYTSTELTQLSMSKLRDAGKEYDVTDNKKDELVSKILAAQWYNEVYLNSLNKEDLGDIVLAMQLETGGDLVATILAVQESE